MADKPDTIQDRYASQFAADLDKNLTEQQEPACLPEWIPRGQ